MVHSPDKRTKVSETSLDLGGESELEALVDVDSVRHGPGAFDALVHAASVRLQPASRTHALKEEPGNIRLVHGRFPQCLMRKLSRADLFGHDEGKASEVRLVHLYLPREDRLEFGKMKPEFAKPSIDSLLAHETELCRLRDGHLLRPAPQQRVPGPEGELHVPKPGSGEQRKRLSAFPAAVPTLGPVHLPRAAPGTEEVLSKDDPLQLLSDLRFRGNLTKFGDHMVQAKNEYFHLNPVPSGIGYPSSGSPMRKLIRLIHYS